MHWKPSKHNVVNSMPILLSTLKSQCISLISTAICIRWLGFLGYIILKILESRIHNTYYKLQNPVFVIEITYIMTRYLFFNHKISDGKQVCVTLHNRATYFLKQHTYFFVKSVRLKKIQLFEMVILRPFLVILLPTTLISFTKLRF